LTDQTVQRVTFPVLGAGAGTTADPAAEVRGHAAGYAAGLRAAQAETAALQVRLQAEHDQRLASLTADTVRRVAVLDAATNALLSQVVPVLRDAEASLADAAVDLAEAVVGYAIRASRLDGATGDSREARGASGAEATVLRALASIDPTVALRVRVSVADAARVADLDTAVPVVGDPSLSDGDAVVDLPDGLLDARIGAALDRAREALGAAR
jgi:flagellar assembly protein FliH